MKTEKLKLKQPETRKLYSYRKVNADKMLDTSSNNTDVTTTCTTVTSTTHFNKV